MGLNAFWEALKSMEFKEVTEAAIRNSFDVITEMDKDFSSTSAMASSMGPEVAALSYTLEIVTFLQYLVTTKDLAEEAVKFVEWIAKAAHSFTLPFEID